MMMTKSTEGVSSLGLGGTLLLILFVLAPPVLALCPAKCTCSLNGRGLKQVVCTKGGMSDPIPIVQMDLDTEVIVISAPVTRPNDLTIGPIFQQFQKLEELHIVHSNVPAIGTHSFWGVQTLRVLNLTHNNVTQLLDANFRGLVQLEELRLDDNRIESMPSATFKFLTALRILTLARNHIEELVPRPFFALHRLEYLDLSGNPLRELNPEVFKDIRTLRTFRCQRCRLSSVNALVYSLIPELQLLDLRDNEFKYLGAGEFRDLVRLRHLHLDGNRLSVILDHSFSAHRLEALSLSRNRIAKLPSMAFANLTVRHLDLSHNKLTALEPPTFHPLAPTLRVLRLSFNVIPMPDLHSALHQLHRLHQLHLAGMSLTELPPDLFVSSGALTNLNLSSNYLVAFQPQLLTPLPALQSLDLSRNQFRGLDEALLDKFDRLRGLRSLHLAGNPWACDLCHIPPILTWINRSRVFKDACSDSPAEDSYCLRCASPFGLSGRPLSSLEPEQLGWCGEENAAPNILPDNSQLGLVVACAIAVLLLLTVLALVVLHNRHAAHYYTHEEERREAAAAAAAASGGAAPIMQEGVFENPAVLDENGDIRFGGDKLLASIATIDEITKDTDLKGPPPPPPPPTLHSFSCPRANYNNGRAANGT